MLNSLFTFLLECVAPLNLPCQFMTLFLFIFDEVYLQKVYFFFKLKSQLTLKILTISRDNIEIISKPHLQNPYNNFINISIIRLVNLKWFPNASINPQIEDFFIIIEWIHLKPKLLALKNMETNVHSVSPKTVSFQSSLLTAKMRKDLSSMILTYWAALMEEKLVQDSISWPYLSLFLSKSFC